MREHSNKEPENIDALVSGMKTDIEAFGKLFRFYQHRIYRYVFSRVRNKCDAEDITAMVFEKALRNIDRYDPDRAKFSTWLYQIATNSVTDHLRKAKIRVDFDMAENMFSLVEDSGAEKVNNYLILTNLIRNLPLSYQEVLVLRFFEGLSLDEMSEILGRRKKYISTLIYRALGSLGKLMEKRDLDTNLFKGDIGER